MFYAVERFEAHLAVLVDVEENTCIVEREALPADVRQGDVLRREEGRFIADREETARRRERIRRLEQMLRGE